MEKKEDELFRRYRETGDVKLRNEIAEKYLYIADILAKKFTGRGVDYDDLKQVASLALLRGIDRFNPDLNMQFTTFITPTITGEIKNYFRDKARMVKLPRRLSDTRQSARFLRRLRGENRQETRCKRDCRRAFRFGGRGSARAGSGERRFAGFHHGKGR